MDIESVKVVPSDKDIPLIIGNVLKPDAAAFAEKLKAEGFAAYSLQEAQQAGVITEECIARDIASDQTNCTAAVFAR